MLVTGRSGAGKSTLFAVLAGLLDPEAAEVTGELTVDGRSPPRPATGWACCCRTRTASW
ncbi:ATP-binding cassette domain-containing protein [Klenkia terrae]|uniref:ATP-binding cassette domain-containing protein n=1 Tax=Klenkia terrae TaxID=1052259 RepID=UPI00361D9BFD